MPIIINNETDSVLSAALTETFNILFQHYLILEELPESSEVSVTLVTPETIHLLNQQWRGVDRSTDVLSFPLYDPDEMTLPGEPVLLGDIIISPDQAYAQAQDYGHSRAREMCYLFVHGLLHLAGYDHMTEEEKRLMREAEEDVLKKAGIDRDFNCD